MATENLKHYKKYLKSLVKFANAIGLKVEFKPEAGDGVYLASYRKIRIDDDMTQAETISTLLHEIGHALDDFVSGDLGDIKVHKAYHAMYYGKPTKKQRAHVVRCEKKAWDNGVSVALHLKIRLGAWYFNHMHASINSYRFK